MFISTSSFLPAQHISLWVTIRCFAMLWASLVAQVVKIWNVGDLSSIPGFGRFPREGKGYPLQYCGLENSMDCIVNGVPKSQKWLSDFHLLCCRAISACKEVRLYPFLESTSKRYHMTLAFLFLTSLSILSTSFLVSGHGMMSPLFMAE